jgi:hypothetical protein
VPAELTAVRADPRDRPPEGDGLWAQGRAGGTRNRVVSNHLGLYPERPPEKENGVAIAYCPRCGIREGDGLLVEVTDAPFCS